jgi:type I restriction enzyme S subunit
VDLPFSEFNLDELGFLGRGKSKHRPRNDPSLYGGKYPFVQTGEVKAANLYVNNFEQTYSDKGLAQSKLWGKDTLVITIAANIAETAILKINACFPDSVVGFIPNDELVDVYFVKYYIDHIKQEMQSISHGTTQDNLSLDKLRTFKLKVPKDRNVVSTVSSTLLNYDNLIENNNRRIAILEDMAQSLYREWFVNFRYPGHVDAVDKDGNQKLIDSPLGLIPEGWVVKRLDDYVILQRGFDLPKRKRNEGGGIPIYAASGLTGYHDQIKAKGPGIVTGRSGTLGIVKLVLEDHWPLNTSLWVKEFKGCTAHYAYYLLDGIGLERFNSGASVPTLNRNDVHGNPVIAPPLELINKFEEIVAVKHKQINLLKRKNTNLKQQRDMLLPKLISGTIEL